MSRFGKSKARKDTVCAKCRKLIPSESWMGFDNSFTPARPTCVPCCDNEVTLGRGEWQNAKKQGTSEQAEVPARGELQTPRRSQLRETQGESIPTCEEISLKWDQPALWSRLRIQELIYDAFYSESGYEQRIKSEMEAAHAQLVQENKDLRERLMKLEQKSGPIVSSTERHQRDIKRIEEALTKLDSRISSLKNGLDGARRLTDNRLSVIEERLGIINIDEQMMTLRIEAGADADEEDSTYGN